MWGRTGKRPSADKVVPTNAPIPLKWGSKTTIYLSDGMGQGNNIAEFDTWVQGICAQLDLWRSSAFYKNKRFADAIATWSGHNNVPSYIAYVKARVPGITEDTIMNDAFWKSPMGLAFLKAQAGHEAGKTYPAPDADWIAAQKRVFSGVPTADTVKKVATAVVVGAGSGGAAAAGAGWSWAEIGLTGFIVAGFVTAIVLMVRKFRSQS
jgi:hypothetical protein